MGAYNIWAASTTLNGFAADEIISCLQKSIRRAMVEEACQYAYELYVSGENVEEAAYDIGRGYRIWKSECSSTGKYNE